MLVGNENLIPAHVVSFALPDGSTIDMNVVPTLVQLDHPGALPEGVRWLKGQLVALAPGRCSGYGCHGAHGENEQGIAVVNPTSGKVAQYGIGCYLLSHPSRGGLYPVSNRYQIGGKPIQATLEKLALEQLRQRHTLDLNGLTFQARRTFGLTGDVDSMVELEGPTGPLWLPLGSLISSMRGFATKRLMTTEEQQALTKSQPR